MRNCRRTTPADFHAESRVSFAARSATIDRASSRDVDADAIPITAAIATIVRAVALRTPYRNAYSSRSASVGSSRAARSAGT
ncbi:MAG: hypothetical protein DMF93_11680 [Acidobacteria bacterium]|nr:MAG: hypothetical protein DMF93_11680 [Acidobacteriota bacterium]